ncbi:HAD-IC family P-type ATPase [Schaalia vaccimaxillae]|uniref:HAD-IC family P-type ATPase n=1 Tax=Schaalia vaccimaxillae TaxID=183916 RepID=UPI0003B67C6A|nr:HAD-IC family P-type ATPase [Schaalia vaccimaxillae]
MQSAPTQSQGLSSAQVESRVAAGQTNYVKQKSSRSIASIIRENVFTLFNAILVVAIGLVLVFGHIQDVVFGGVMIFNAIIGIFSEWRAKRTLDALAIVDAPTARVRRDGVAQDIGTEEVVLDDVLELALGDQICVDGTVLESSGLEVDESMLTGESKPVKKAAGDSVLAGTSVTAGSAVIHADAVGDDMYAQGISRAARKFQRTTSEIQQSINSVLRVISALIIPVVTLTIWSQARIADEATGGWRGAIVLGVASVVGMIPQGLVLLTSMNFAIGSAALARRGVLVQELPAVEVLARVDALCVDKTGTLTTGRIRVREVIDLLGDTRATGAALSALAQDRTNATAQAIDDFLSDGRPARESDTDFWAIPFSSARKWSAWGTPESSWMLGAPELLLTDQNQEAINKASQIAASGLRVVALVRCDEQPSEEVMPGVRQAAALVVLEEDLRDDAAQTLEFFRGQGVHVRVISGDNPGTVAALATQAGLQAPGGAPPRAMDARDLPQDVLSDEFQEAVLTHDIFGRVTPEQKRAMVGALQAGGHCVAMTGDGVNDALALKDADLGIAMGNGAQATKAVAQIVLVDSKFSVLPGVLAEGRRIIANMERVSALFLAKTCYAAIFVIMCAILGWAYPFLPRHFTYVDALTIGIPGFFIALAPNPRRYVPGFLRRTLSLAIPSGMALGAVALTVYALVGPAQVDGRTAAALSLTIGALWLLSITARPLEGWRIGLIASMIVIALVGVLLPSIRSFFALAWPSSSEWVMIAAGGVVAAMLIEVAHRAYHRRAHEQAQREHELADQRSGAGL